MVAVGRGMWRLDMRASWLWTGWPERKDVGVPTFGAYVDQGGVVTSCCRSGGYCGCHERGGVCRDRAAEGRDPVSGPASAAEAGERAGGPAGCGVPAGRAGADDRVSADRAGCAAAAAAAAG